MTGDNPFAAPALAEPIHEETKLDADSIFDRDLFLLKQRYLSLKERYHIADEDGRELLEAVRPRYIILQFVAAFVGVIIFFAGMAASLTLTFASEAASDGNWIMVAVFVLGLMASAVVAGLVGLALSPYRHTTITMHGRERPLLRINQDTKFNLLYHWFSLRDPNGQVIARFRRNVLAGLFRTRWDILDSDDQPTAVVYEDDLWQALARRWLGPLIAKLALPTNFVFKTTDDEHLLGRLDRTNLILDRYRLDMESDEDNEIDRRVAVAMGILLDTGTKR